jgi:hypothetical protein
MATPTPIMPPRPLAPGDVVAAFCEALGEWAAAQITVEITASKKDGFPDDKTRIVSENARTLKFDQYGFEDR